LAKQFEAFAQTLLLKLVSANLRRVHFNIE